MSLAPIILGGGRAGLSAYEVYVEATEAAGGTAMSKSEWIAALGGRSFQTLAQAVSWIGDDLPPDGTLFAIENMFFLTEDGATSVPGLDNAVTAGVPYLDQYGLEDDLTVDASDAWAAAIAAGEKRVLGKSGKTYLSLTMPDLTGVSDFTLLGTDHTTKFKQGPDCFPGFYIGPGARNVWFENLTIVGNHAEAGDYDYLLTTEGITDGSTAGTLTSGASSGATSIPLEGLGTGWVRVGDRIEFLDGGTKYGYIVTADVQISSGAATLTINEGIDVDLDSGHTIYVKQYGNRQTLTQAYSAGATEITFGAASVTGQMLAGDQIAFHTNNNEISSIDYDEIYEIKSDATYTGTYPNMLVTVTLTEGLATDKVKGQMITSVQDTRNNRHSLLLAYGTTNCGVRNVKTESAQLHAIAANACVRSPWMGTDPEENKNVNFKILDSEDLSTEPGSSFVSAHGKIFTVKGCESSVLALTRNGVQAEQTDGFRAIDNTLAKKKTGVMATGEAQDSLIEVNDTEDCTVHFDVRNITRRSELSGNIVRRGANTVYGMRLKAGEPDIDDGDDAFKTMATVGKNIFGGAGVVTGTYGGTDIIVQPTRIGTDYNDRLRPHLILLEGNIMDEPPRHGFAFFQAAYVAARGNIVNRPGYNGFYGTTCEELGLEFNRVIDAGQAESANAYERSAYHLEACEKTDWHDNDAILLTTPTSDSKQLYGLWNGSGNTYRTFRGTQRLRGVTGRTNDAGPMSSIFMGYAAGLDSDLAADRRNAAFGAFALANVSSGLRNAAIGYAAGQVVTDGDRNTFVGAQTNGDNASRSNGLALGYNAEVRQDGEIAIGDKDGTYGVLTAANGSALVEGGAIVLPDADGLLYVRLNGTLYAVPIFAVTDPNPPS